jgi:hypothetical protein
MEHEHGAFKLNRETGRWGRPDWSGIALDLGAQSVFIACCNAKDIMPQI